MPRELFAVEVDSKVGRVEVRDLGAAVGVRVRVRVRAEARARARNGC